MDRNSLLAILALFTEGWFSFVNCTTFQANNVVPAITTVPSGIPLSTTHVVITGNRQLLSIPANVFFSHTSLTYADFSSNNISLINADAFKGTILQTLILYDNWFTQVPAIDHISSTLTLFNLKWNALLTMPANSLAFYPNLVELDISLNKIQWTDAKLDGLLNVVNTLNKLDIGNTDGPPSGSPADLSRYAFQNLTELKVSKVTNLPNIPTLPSNVVHLDVWDLTINSLTNTQISSFSGSFTVGELKLSQNSLTSMPAFSNNVWKSKLNFLRLNHNAITQVDSTAFDGMSTLVTLNLASNVITQFPNFTDALLPLLEEIYLSDNLITSVPAASLANLTSLMFLWLDNNPLAVFGDLSTLLPSFAKNLYLGLTGGNFVCNCSFTFILQAYNSVYPNVTVALDTIPCSSPHELATTAKYNLSLLQVCPGSQCDPIPTWKDIRVNTSSHLLGQTIQYFCREGYLFTTTSSDNELKTTRCNALTGIWEPDFESCTEKENPQADAEFNKPVESDLAEVIGTFTLIFVCAEIALLMALDITHFKHCCKKCKTKVETKRKSIHNNKIEAENADNVIWDNSESSV